MLTKYLIAMIIKQMVKAAIGLLNMAVYINYHNGVAGAVGAAAADGAATGVETGIETSGTGRPGRRCHTRSGNQAR